MRRRRGSIVQFFVLAPYVGIESDGWADDCCAR
jgi:hypothetical protein